MTRRQIAIAAMVAVALTAAFHQNLIAAYAALSYRLQTTSVSTPTATMDDYLDVRIGDSLTDVIEQMRSPYVETHSAAYGDETVRHLVWPTADGAYISLTFRNGRLTAKSLD